MLKRESILNPCLNLWQVHLENHTETRTQLAQLPANFLGDLRDSAPSDEVRLCCVVRSESPSESHLINSCEVTGVAYRKRVFLNPISISAPSFIQAVADSSDEGTHVLGNYILIIADCDRRIMLEFCLANKKQRKMSLAKIDRLLKVVTEFRDAVYAEAELIEKEAKAKRTQ